MKGAQLSTRPLEAARKILIVDDDKEMVLAIKRILFNSGGFIVETANDGGLALQKIDEFNPDLIFLDIKMPGMDGFDLCRTIRQDLGNNAVKIVIISGMLDMDGMERIMKLGADDYLTKPFRNEYLLMKIDRLLTA